MESDLGDGDIKSIPRADSIAPAQIPLIDNKAEAEFIQLSKGLSVAELEEDARKDELRRAGKFKNHFERIVVLSLYVVAIYFLICGFIWILQIILPEKLRWISGERFDKLQDIVTGGAFFGIVLDHFRKRTR